MPNIDGPYNSFETPLAYWPQIPDNFTFSFQIPSAIKEFYKHPPDHLPAPTVDYLLTDPPDLNKTEQQKAEASLEEQEHVSMVLLQGCSDVIGPCNAYCLACSLQKQNMDITFIVVMFDDLIKIACFNVICQNTQTS